MAYVEYETHDHVVEAIKMMDGGMLNTYYWYFREILLNCFYQFQYKVAPNKQFDMYL